MILPSQPDFVNNTAMSSAPDAKKELMRLPGVGPKVAECILLYGYYKTDAFPIDVWIERTMKEWYLSEGATRGQIQRFAEEKFGKFGGIAQQYMFFYARAKKEE